MKTIKRTQKFGAFLIDEFFLDKIMGVISELRSDNKIRTQESISFECADGTRNICEFDELRSFENARARRIVSIEFEIYDYSDDDKSTDFEICIEKGGKISYKIEGPYSEVSNIQNKINSAINESKLYWGVIHSAYFTNAIFLIIIFTGSFSVFYNCKYFI